MRGGIVDGGIIYGYDAPGSLRQKTDADGRFTFFGYYGYDASRRPTTMSFDVDPWIYYTYDSLGNLKAVKDESGNTITYFDFLNRPVQKTTTSGTVYYAYDRSSLKTQVWQPDPATAGTFSGTYHVYDAARRLAYAAPFGGSGGAATTIRPVYYAYDNSGMRTAKALYGNGVLSYYQYDNAGRLSNLQNLNSSLAAITYYNYTRDANGNPTTINREAGLNINYKLDSLDRLTSELWNSGSGPAIYGFYYNYDACSNRYFKYNAVAASLNTTYYTYDQKNQLSTEVNQ